MHPIVLKMTDMMMSRCNFKLLDVIILKQVDYLKFTSRKNRENFLLGLWLLCLYF